MWHWIPWSSGSSECPFFIAAFGEIGIDFFHIKPPFIKVCLLKFLAAECESLDFRLREGGTGMGDVAKQEFWVLEGKNSLFLEQKSCHLF